MSIDVLITPEVIVSENYLKSYPKDKRQCMFDGDRWMKYYRNFSEKNCEMECLSAIMKIMCGCTPYRIFASPNVKMCTIDDIYCDRYYEFYVSRRRSSDFMRKTCNCLPACNSIKYNVEIIPKKIANASNNEVVITFKFKENTYTALRRYQQFQFIDFVSQSGGILGLFAGVSLLSIIELFYLMVVRNVTNLFRLLNCKLKSMKTMSSD